MVYLKVYPYYNGALCRKRELMTELISDNAYSRAFKQKRGLLLIWLLTAALYLVVIGFSVGYNLYDVLINGSRAFRAAATVISIAATFLFFSFTLFFFSVKYRLTKAYCKLLKDFREGLSEITQGEFLAFKSENETKDGVDCYAFEADCNPLSRDFDRVRKFLIVSDLPRPPFEAGMRLKLKTHAGFLLAYEIIK